MQPVKPRRRARIPLSCEACRARKLKCNRELPCQNCTARKEGVACRFQGSSKGGDVPQVVRSGSDGGGDATRKRIDRLEGLVKKLIAERQHASSSEACGHSSTSPHTRKSDARDAVHEPTSDVVSASGGTGDTIIDGIHSVYHGGDEWHTVLREINELKNSYTQQDGLFDDTFRPAQSHTGDGSGLLYNQARPVERTEILSTLPPKPEVDRLISQFFDHRNFPISYAPILHQPTFMREYDEHWKDPSRTHIIWLGLLFSILGITMLAYHQYGEPPEYEGTSESLFQLYRHRTAQCLQSGDISKGLPYTVEALRLNATAELNRKDDIRRGLWIMTGVMVRVAINMGYHRDPAHTPGLSVLQGEYRRRIWLSVIGMDDMTSFVGGFPRMMLAIHADTQEPRNLHDWELTEETTVLPPSRPLTEATSLTYLLVKSRLFKALGRVGDLTTSPAPASYETVLEIDRALRAAYDGFPPHMRLDNSPAGHKGPLRPNVRADFVGVSLLGMYHRGMCTLHRRWLAKSRVDDRYKLSRERCVSSALTTLGFQHGLESSWYALAQTRHMFILAGTVLVLELELRRKAPEEVEVPDGEVLVSALERSCANWAAVTATGDEALRFHRFLRGVVKGFRSRTSVEAGDGTEDRASQTLVAKQPEFDFHGVVPPLEISGGGLMFEQELPGMDIDWVTWDTFIENSATGFDTGPLYRC